MLSEWSQKCKDARVSEGETLADVLAPGLALTPNKTAIHFEDQTYSYRDLDELANRAANGLIGVGE